MEQKKNILIISYVFPPYPGIGGRRWAKFAKYLHRNGHNVYVIAAQNPFENISTFINDINELPKENIYYLPAKYPTILLKQPKTFFEKLQYHFWIRVLPFFTKGNYYDRSMFWEKQLQKKITDLINTKKIDTIIVSGPPFHLVYSTIQLKQLYPDIKFIVDYRDEWTFNDVHGFGIIGKKRQEEEFRKEKFICENADFVISCDSIIIDYLDKKYNCNLYHLPHGFDKDDFKKIEITASKNNKNNKIKIGYFGTVYSGTEKFFIEWVKLLDYIKNKYLNIDLQLDIYTIDHFHYEDIIKGYEDKIVIHKNLPANQLFNKINNCDFILIMPSLRAKDYITSKFPEIFYLQKPIILYSEPGKVSEFIEKHKIGIHLPKENFSDVLLSELKDPQQFDYSKLNINEWDYEYLTQQLLNHIQ